MMYNTQKSHARILHRCKYCQRRFVGNTGWRFHKHRRSHEQTIKPYWYKKKTSATKSKVKCDAISAGVEVQLPSSGNCDDVTETVHEQSKPAHRYCTDDCQPTASHKAITTSTNILKKRYHCQFCPRCFSQKGGLVIHERIHRGDKPFICDICDAAFYDKSNLRKHRRIHTGEKLYKCKYCSKGFTDASCCKNHEYTNHIGKTTPRYKCTICDKGFNTSTRLRDHEFLHTGQTPHICTLCDKTFTRSSTMRIHQQIHSGERPFKCEFEGCSSAFVRRSKLNDHIKRIHVREKPHQCKFCERVFAIASPRNQHERRCQHNPNAVARIRFKCNYCEVDLSTNTARIAHERIHTGEKPFVCGNCKAAFIHSKSLWSHQKQCDR